MLASIHQPIKAAGAVIVDIIFFGNPVFRLDLDSHRHFDFLGGDDDGLLAVLGGGGLGLYKPLDLEVIHRNDIVITMTQNNGVGPRVVVMVAVL